MRIALIAETFTTGVGRHVADLMIALCQRGHEVHLLHGNRCVAPALVQQVETLPGAHVRAVPMKRAPHPRDVFSLWDIWRYLRSHAPFDTWCTATVRRAEPMHGCLQRCYGRAACTRRTR